jgi:hypothetical protein
MKTRPYIMIFLSQVFCACLAAPAQGQVDAAQLLPKLQKLAKEYTKVQGEKDSDKTFGMKVIQDQDQVKVNIPDQDQDQDQVKVNDKVPVQKALLNPVQKDVFNDVMKLNQDLDQAEKDLVSIVAALQSWAGVAPLDTQDVNNALHAVAKKSLTSYPTANDLKNLGKSGTRPGGTLISGGSSVTQPGPGGVTQPGTP